VLELPLVEQMLLEVTSTHIAAHADIAAQLSSTIQSNCVPEWTAQHVHLNQS
jgi:hypothetical protein